MRHHIMMGGPHSPTLLPPMAHLLLHRNHFWGAILHLAHVVRPLRLKSRELEKFGAPHAKSDELRQWVCFRDAVTAFQAPRFTFKTHLGISNTSSLYQELGSPFPFKPIQKGGTL